MIAAPRGTERGLQVGLDTHEKTRTWLRVFWLAASQSSALPS